MNKKIIYLIILIVVVVILFIGFSNYKNLFQRQNTVQNPENNTAGNKTEINTGNTEEEQNSGGLFICADRCGDDTCQSEVCTNNMNCPCLETPEDCPQDCGE